MLVVSANKANRGIWVKPYPRGWTLLHLAAAAGSTDIVNPVLEMDHDCGTFRVKNKGWSLVHIAARTGHVDLLSFLIKWDREHKTAMIEAHSSDEATPLFAASKFGQAAAVNLLLQKRARFDVRPKGKVQILPGEERADLTGLHIAAFGGHVETVETLLRPKRIEFVEALLTDKSETALHLAVQNDNKSCSDIIAILVAHVSTLARGKYVNSKVKSEEAKAQFIERNRVSIEAKATEASRRFLDSTAEFGFMQQGRKIKKKKATALHVAAASCNVAAVTKLLELGAQPNAQIEDGETALHVAARKGNLAIVKALCQRDSDPGLLTRDDNHGDTALHLAARHDRWSSFPTKT